MDAPASIAYNEGQNRFVRVGGETDGRLPVKTLCPVAPDEIYVGTDGEGMKVYHPSADRLENVHVSTVGFNFDKAKVHAILEDNQGNLWLGLFQKGVLIVPTRSSGFRYLGYKVSADNPIGSSCIMAVCKDRDNRLWVGTDNDGLYCVAPDGSRLWDKETLEKMDKDRFRQSLGGLIEAYEAVARRLGVQLD